MKFGRKSDQWIFADSSPTLDREPKLDEMAVSPIFTGARNRTRSPLHAVELDTARLNEAIGYLPSNGETKILHDMEHIMCRYKINEKPNANLVDNINTSMLSTPKELLDANSLVLEEGANFGLTHSSPDAIISHKINSEDCERIAEQGLLTSDLILSEGITNVKQSALDSSANQTSFRERQPTSNSTIQEKADSLQSINLRLGATNSNHATTILDEETRKATPEEQLNSQKILESSGTVHDTKPPHSTSEPPIFSQTRNGPDSQLVGNQDVSSDSNMESISPEKSLDTDSVAADISSEISSDIVSEISSEIMSEISSEIVSEIPSEIVSEISSEISSDDHPYRSRYHHLRYDPRYNPKFYTGYSESDSDAESENIVLDVSSDSMTEPSVSDSSEEILSSEPENASSEDDNENIDYHELPDTVEKGYSRSLSDENGGHQHTIPNSMLERRKSTDDARNETSEFNLGMDGSSYLRSLSMPPDTLQSSSKGKSFTKAGKGFVIQPKNQCPEWGDEDRKSFRTGTEVFISPQPTQHSEANLSEGEKSFETEDKVQSAQSQENLEIKVSAQVAPSHKQREESVYSPQKQAETRIDGENTGKEVEVVSKKIQVQDQINLQEKSRHVDDETNMGLESEETYPSIDVQTKMGERVDDLLNSHPQIELSKVSRKSSVDGSQISGQEFIIEKSFNAISQDEDDDSKEIPGDKSKGTFPMQKPVVEVIDLESEDEDNVPSNSKLDDSKRSSIEPTSANQSHFKNSISASETAERAYLRSASPDALSRQSDHDGSDLEDISNKIISSNVQLDNDLFPNTIPETLPLYSNFQDESALQTQFSQSPPENAEIELRPSVLVLEKEATDDQDVDSRFRRQLLTPKPSQQTSLLSEQSAILNPDHDGHDLPTPTLTQSSSVPPAPPRTPEQPHKPTLIEKLRSMRSISAQKARDRTSINTLNAVSPWFAQKETNKITHVSDSEADAESQTTDYDLTTLRGDRQQDQAKTIFLVPNLQLVVEKDSALIHPTNTIENSPGGFRTSLSYFAPLKNLSSHYNSQIDVLATVLAATPIVQAESGPRDYNQTLSITDPSLASSPNPIINAQIFRPNKSVFPFVAQGDSILLRNFKIQSFQHSLGLLSTASSAWAVFRRDVEVQIKGPPVEFGAEERGFAKGLWGWWGSLGAAKIDEFRKMLERKNDVKEEKRDVSEGDDDETVKGEQTDKEADTEVTPKKSLQRNGRKRPRGRPSRGEGVVRHELRDGTSYTDGKIKGKGGVHELRDGTTYSDGVEQ